VDASPLLADSCSGFWAPMQLLAVIVVVVIVVVVHL